jgi:hypothetical protein
MSPIEVNTFGISMEMAIQIKEVQSLLHPIHLRALEDII